MWQRLLIAQGTRISSLQLYPLRRSCGALSSEHCRCHLLLVILRQSLSARRVWRDSRCDITYQSGALPWPARPIRADPAPTGYQVSVRCQSVSICLCQDIPQSGRVSGDWSWIPHEDPDHVQPLSRHSQSVRASYLRVRAVRVLSALSGVMSRLTGNDYDVWQQTSLWPFVLS